MPFSFSLTRSTLEIFFQAPLSFRLAHPFYVIRRKFVLTKICKDLLIDYKEYVRLTSGQVFSKFNKEEVIENLMQIGQLNENEKHLSLAELLKKLRQFERTRYFACWNESSSLNNHSHFLVTKNVMYDKASFLTNDKIT